MFKINKVNGADLVIEEKELIRNIEIYNDIVTKLSKFMNSANIVGTYAEILVCKFLNLTMADNSNKDYDAISANKKYQIKSRWNKEGLKSKGQNEFGSINYKEDGNYEFDYLILVYFDRSLLNPKIYSIDSKDINDFVEYPKGKKFIYMKEQKIIIKYNENFIKEGKIKLQYKIN